MTDNFTVFQTSVAFRNLARQTLIMDPQISWPYFTLIRTPEYNRNTKVHKDNAHVVFELRSFCLPPVNVAVALLSFVNCINQPTYQCLSAPRSVHVYTKLSSKHFWALTTIYLWPLSQLALWTKGTSKLFSKLYPFFSIPHLHGGICYYSATLFTSPNLSTFLKHPTKSTLLNHLLS